MEISIEDLNKLSNQFAFIKRGFDELERDFIRLTGGASGSALYLVHVPDHGGGKISTIKAIRQMTGLGLREAKEITDRVQMGDKVFIKHVSRSDPGSADMQSVLWIEESGSKVEWRDR